MTVLPWLFFWLAVLGGALFGALVFSYVIADRHYHPREWVRRWVRAHDWERFL